MVPRMKEYNISVLGSQSSEPRTYISFLQAEFNVPTKIINLKKDGIDRMIQIEIFFGKKKCIFSSPIHALWDYEGAYEKLLQKCDGVIYMLDTRKDSDSINKKDFQIFTDSCNKTGLQIPTITLFNNICYQMPWVENLEYSDLLKYVLLNSPVFETQINRHSSKQCNQTVLSSLKYLLHMIEPTPGK